MIVRARLRAALADVTAQLGAAGVPSPSVDARALIEEAACAQGPLVLLEELPDDFESRLARLSARRSAREPLQLILGRAPFRRLLLETSVGVFVPRPETEVAIDLVLAHHREHPVRHLVDLCTGSGALAAAVIDELPAAEVVAAEIDPAAAELAARNLARARHDGAPGTGRVLIADVTDPRALAELGPVDVVVSNPPYIPPDAVPRDAEVLEHDPPRALYGGGADGMEIPRAVIERARELLSPGGLLVMEHADVQGGAAREAAESIGGFEQIRTAEDLTGRDRFLVARRAADRPGPHGDEHGGDLPDAGPRAAVTGDSGRMPA